jgi:hypothetical protein
MSRRISPDLLRVAEGAMEAELAALRRQRARETGIAAEIAELKAERARIVTQLASLADPAAAARWPAWIAWCNRRTAELQARLAAERVAREEGLARVRRAFGRKSAIEALLARQATIDLRMRREQ